MDMSVFGVFAFDGSQISIDFCASAASASFYMITVLTSHDHMLRNTSLILSTD